MDKAGGRSVTIGVVAFLTLRAVWSVRRRLTLALFGKGEGERTGSATQRLNEGLRPSGLSLPLPQRGRGRFGSARGLATSVIPEAAQRLSGIATPSPLRLEHPDPDSSRAPHAAAGMTEARWGAT